MDLKRINRRLPAFVMAVLITVWALMPYGAEEAYAFSGKVGSKYNVTDGGRITYGSGDGGYSNSKKTDLDDSLGNRYSYCVQPDKPTPTATRVTVDKVVTDEDDRGKWNALRNIIYYSPSYPGYDDNVKGIRESYYTGNFSKDWGIAHLALSYAYAGRPSDLATYGGTKASDLGEIWTKAKKLGDALWADGSERDDAVPESFKVFISYMEGVQNMIVGYMEAPGRLSIKKLSGIPDITGNNSQYSLSDAVYTVYGSDGKEAGTLTTKSDGSGGPLELPEGSYKVKETKVPKGYAKDDKEYTVKIQSEEDTLLEVSDIPVTARPETILKKRTEGFDREGPEGDASYKGAVFSFSYYPDGNFSGTALKTWYFVTDERGNISGTSPVQDPGSAGSSLYLNKSGEIVFPLGSYLIREITPPEGYLKGEKDAVLKITDDLSGNQFTKAVTETVYREEIIKGGVKIQKTDLELDEDVPQGDGSLKGAEFTIINRSKNPVVYGGRMSEPGEEVMVIKTDEKGRAETPEDALPYGTYAIKETGAPEGYYINESWERVFEIRENRTVVDLTEYRAAEKIWRGGLMLQKRDMELGSSESQGGASLEGISFTIKNVSDHDVLVRNFEKDILPEWDSREDLVRLIEKGDVKRISPGEDVGTITTYWNEDKKAYTAETLSDDLPYGTYTIRESATNDSYQRTDKSEHRFEIRDDGKLYAFDEGHEEILSFDDLVYRSDFYGIKIQDSSSKRMSYIPFKVTSLTTGECHVAVCDRNGVISSRDRRTEDEIYENEKGENGRKANPFDDLLENKNITEKTILERAGDIRMGVWFGKGEFGSEASVKSDCGSLPYDTYIIEEMPCEGNRGHVLQKFMFTVDDKSLTGLVDLGTVTDDMPEIRTSAAVGGRKTEVPVSADTVLTDTIKYSGLIRGETYRIRGILMDKETAMPLKGKDGKDISADLVFTAKKSSGKVRAEFRFDSLEMKGKTTVVFERLYDSKGHLLAIHEDINDTDQTIIWEKEEPVPEEPVTRTQEKKGNDPKKPAVKTKVPKTSDTTEMMTWILTLITAAAGTGLSAVHYRRNKKRMPGC